MFLQFRKKNPAQVEIGRPPKGTFFWLRQCVQRNTTSGGRIVGVIFSGTAVARVDPAKKWVFKTTWLYNKAVILTIGGATPKFLSGPNLRPMT